MAAKPGVAYVVEVFVLGGMGLVNGPFKEFCPCCQ